MDLLISDRHPVNYSVLVELRPLLIPEPPGLLVQSNVIAPATHVVVFAVCLVELLVQGVDLAFGVADFLLEHPDVLKQAVTVGAPPVVWGVAAGVRVEGHVWCSVDLKVAKDWCWVWCCLGCENAVTEYDAV